MLGWCAMTLIILHELTYIEVMLCAQVLGALLLKSITWLSLQHGAIISRKYLDFLIG